MLGDRIKNVTISFEHMVYEDALTILSYASPYEVIIEAKNGKLLSNSASQGAQPGHPLFRSASIGDLLQVRINKLSKLRTSIIPSFSFLFASRLANLLRKDYFRLTTLTIQLVPLVRVCKKHAATRPH